MFMPHWPSLFGRKKDYPGLERMQRFLDHLGNPEQSMPPAIHVAGTNGKGSTIAFMEAILTQAGYRVHRYTSPHLIHYNERISIAGMPIDDHELLLLIERCREVEGADDVSMFEAATAEAFLAFAKHPADVVLVETGLGGRIDPTNTIINKLASVITPVGLDHKEYLGPDIRTIAAEKAGIVMPGIPCIIGIQEREAMEVLSVMAYKAGATLFRYGYEWGIEETEDGYLLISQTDRLPLPLPHLRGRHQIFNAGLAMAAIMALPQFEITEDHIIMGLKTAYWPGRLEEVTEPRLLNLLPTGSECFFDGAHNPHGASVIASWLSEQDDRPTIMIFGTTKGKDVIRFIEYFSGLLDGLMTVQVKSERDAYSSATLSSLFEAEAIDSVQIDSLDEGFELIGRGYDEPVRVLITGSLFFARDIRL